MNKIEKQIIKSALAHGAAKVAPESIFKQRVLEATRLFIMLRKQAERREHDKALSNAVYRVTRQIFSAGSAAGNRQWVSKAGDIGARILAASGRVQMGDYQTAAQHYALGVRDLRQLLTSL